jgi:hypothetical protein
MMESEVVRKEKYTWNTSCKTIELMKTPKDNRCAQVRTHAKGYLLDGEER